MKTLFAIVVGSFIGCTALLIANTTPTQVQSNPCASLRQGVESGSHDGSLVSDGLKRSFIVYIPTDYDPAQAVPLVISLHGYNSNAEQQQVYTAWNNTAESETFIVVYPNGAGSPQQWQAYDFPSITESPDDVQFIRDLIADLSENYCIDGERIYVNGISNGGAMTVRLGCELANQIAAIGTVAAAVLRNRTCTSVLPMPLIAFHGTADDYVPYAGGFVFVPASDWIMRWARNNGCDDTPQPYAGAGDVSGIQYINCDARARVNFYTIDGGGHTLPGADIDLEFLLGYTTQDIDAIEAMWRFFTAYRRS